MVQIQRVALFPNAAFHIALRRVFGLGRSTSLQVAEACGISKDLKVKDIKETYLQKVASYIEANFVTGDALRRQIRENVAAEVAINSQRGMHHVRMSRQTKAGLQRSPLFTKDAKRQ
ncbi:hypothetical protein Vretimale_12393 [Volvox reticuliferus]|uniref:Mitochondrial ribosomal protein S13 n=1 Tax=Volvox reticuliferus TaxID=1737510 RepID=A0A8J4FQ37_9CHLO|nr:hypothetical protein Vretifemale_9091 [Volvox reticuliferus]GIM08407.1 hypothetical protein Vretimale_12393 [Volvox reticuliferus]